MDIKPKPPVEGPIKIKKVKPHNAKPPVTTVKGRVPLDAMRDMGKQDISRHERAEEAIRQHFRDNFERLQEEYKLNELA